MEVLYYQGTYEGRSSRSNSAKARRTFVHVNAYSAIAAANSAVCEYLLTTKGNNTTPTTDDDEAQSSNTCKV